MDNSMKYSVSMILQEIKLPPFDEILVLGKNSPHGKNGISKSFELLLPNGFEVFDINENNVEAVFVNKRILAKLPLEKLMKLLKERVFPFVSEGELLKVDLKISITYTSSEDDL